jgi:hypothetical protein
MNLATNEKGALLRESSLKKSGKSFFLSFYFTTNGLEYNFQTYTITLNG